MSEDSFEKMFGRLVDRKMAPPRTRWMCKMERFTTKQYQLAFKIFSQNRANNGLKKWLDRGQLKIVSLHRVGTKGPGHTWEWIGDL